VTLHLLKCELCEKEIITDVFTDFDLTCPICQRGRLQYTGKKYNTVTTLSELIECYNDDELSEKALNEICERAERAPITAGILRTKEKKPVISIQKTTIPPEYTTKKALILTPPVIESGKYKGLPAPVDVDKIPDAVAERIADALKTPSVAEIEAKKQRTFDKMIKEIEEIRAAGYGHGYTNKKISAIGKAFYVMYHEVLPGFRKTDDDDVKQIKHYKTPIHRKGKKHNKEKCEICGRMISINFMALHLKTCKEKHAPTLADKTPVDKTPVDVNETPAVLTIVKRDADRVTHQ
jgi:hypothetical protein